MNKQIFLVLCLVLVVFCHNKQRPAQNSIYEPFTDVPKLEDYPTQTQNINIQDQRQIKQDEDQSKEDRQKQVQEFNQMLYYGLIFGTILLAFMLTKTCTVNGRLESQQRMVRGQLRQRYSNETNNQILNKSIKSHEIRQKIESMKKQVQRLQLYADQLQFNQKKIIEQNLQQKNRPKVTHGYYNQVQMQKHQPGVYYNQEYLQTGFESIPIGRPIPCDNNSSFASQYPVI